MNAKQTSVLFLALGQNFEPTTPSDLYRHGFDYSDDGDKGVVFEAAFPGNDVFVRWTDDAGTHVHAHIWSDSSNDSTSFHFDIQAETFNDEAPDSDEVRS